MDEYRRLRWYNQQLFIQRGQQFLAFKQLLAVFQCGQFSGEQLGDEQLIGRWQLCFAKLFCGYQLHRQSTGAKHWQ